MALARSWIRVSGIRQRPPNGAYGPLRRLSFGGPRPAHLLHPFRFRGHFDELSFDDPTATFPQVR
ncbi:MAG: hypothetical protein D6725_15240 [Planctomycetota bacterium]|nr:MAG: hypothetical protein D6725_15240 [Planctomycetota bacterium]